VVMLAIWTSQDISWIDPSGCNTLMIWVMLFFG
jgi:hypothetical protein